MNRVLLLALTSSLLLAVALFARADGGQTARRATPDAGRRARRPPPEATGPVVIGDMTDPTRTKFDFVMDDHTIQAIAFSSWRRYGNPDSGAQTVHKGGSLDLIWPQPSTGAPAPRKVTAAISTTAGALDAQRAVCGPATARSRSLLFTWAAIPNPRSPHNCVLEPDKTYYLNVKFVDANGVGRGCEKSSPYCGARLSMGYNDPL